MKKFRSSFNHLIREKLIAGQSDITPTPETRELSKLYPDVVVDHTGNFEFANDTGYQATYVNDSWYSQGSMGYGNAPIGTGTSPYQSFMSNKINSTQAADAYTGASDKRPSITFGPLHHTGAAATFAIGVAQQYIQTGSTSYHAYPREGLHDLVTVYGVSVMNTSGVSDATDVQNPNNGIIRFYYDNRPDPEDSTLALATNNKSFRLSVSVTDESGTRSGQLTLSGVHFYTCYGRLMPVAFELSADGSFTFRVDSTTLTGSIQELTNKDGSFLMMMPSSGDLYMSVKGLEVNPYVSPRSGLYNPISRLTNLAVNDNDNSDGKNNTGLPPFITGIPCTPVRSTETDWDLPLQVIDPDSGWIPYSESSPTVEYGLSAVADSQLFETRGVAASGTNKPLHVYTANKATLLEQLTNRGLSNVDQVESINTLLFESAVFGENELSVEIQQTGTYTNITAQQTFPGIQNDFNNSVVTFYHDINGLDMNLDTFNNGLVFTLTVN